MHFSLPARARQPLMTSRESLTRATPREWADFRGAQERRDAHDCQHDIDADSSMPPRRARLDELRPQTLSPGKAALIIAMACEGTGMAARKTRAGLDEFRQALRRCQGAGSRDVDYARWDVEGRELTMMLASLIVSCTHELV